MSPRRIDPGTIAARSAAMVTLIGALDDTDPAEVHHDLRARLAVERALTQLVELAASINDHVVGALARDTATSYRDSFVLAAEVGLISEALRDELLPAAGMRNVLVHEYVTINLDRVADATPLARDVFRRYLAAVATFVDDLDS